VDVLCVGGGPGRTVVIKEAETLAFIARIGATARYVMSVCAGSFILAAAGLLRGYSYLWTREHAAGADEGRKTRPSAIVAARRVIDGREIVTVVPITHTAPKDPADAIEIPAVLKIIWALMISCRGSSSLKPMTSSGQAPTSAPSRKVARTLLWHTAAPIFAHLRDRIRRTNR
jgi:hypothetical protein